MKSKLLKLSREADRHAQRAAVLGAESVDLQETSLAH